MKGFYAQARDGKIKGFTGVDDPYEEPLQPEVSIDATHTTPEQAAQQLLAYLEKQGILPRS